MLDEVKALASVFQSRHLHIDSLVFRLHCRLTTIALCVALFIVCTTQFVSKPIYCDPTSLSVDHEMLNAHCYMHSTYRLVKWYYLEVGDLDTVIRHRDNDSRMDNFRMAAFPGVHGGLPQQLGIQRTERITYTYYQWIWVVYLMQAIAFYCPNWCWKQLESNRMKSLVDKIDLFESKKKCTKLEADKAVPSCDKSRLELFALYMDHSFGSNGSYMRAYFGCELMAVCNVLLQMFLLNRMFHGRWLTYGLDVAELYWKVDLFANDAILGEDINPMTLLFPKQTKCAYRRFGPSGQMDLLDSLCILTMNNFNDKFFLVLWLWMYLLLCLFVTTCLFRVLQYSIVRMRVKAIKDRVTYEPDTKGIFKRDLALLVRDIQVADWFVLSNVGRNLDPQNFYEALAAIIKLRQLRVNRKAQQDQESIAKYVIEEA